MVVSEAKRKIFNYLLGSVGVFILIITAILLFNSYDDATGWVDAKPERFEISNIQERTKMGEEDFFFKIHYYYSVDGVEYSFYHDPGYFSYAEAEYQANTYKMPDDFTFRYKENDPAHVAEFESNNSFMIILLWMQFGGALLAVVIGLLYINNKKKKTFDEVMSRQGGALRSL